MYGGLPADEGSIDENGSKISKTQIGNHRYKAEDRIIKQILVLGSLF